MRQVLIVLNVLLLVGHVLGILLLLVLLSDQGIDQVF